MNSTRLPAPGKDTGMHTRDKDSSPTSLRQYVPEDSCHLAKEVTGILHSGGLPEATVSTGAIANSRWS